MCTFMVSPRSAPSLHMTRGTSPLAYCALAGLQGQNQSSPRCTWPQFLTLSHATHTAIPASSATQEERSLSWLSALSCELMPSMNSQRGQLSYPCFSCHPDFLPMCHTLTNVLR